MEKTFQIFPVVQNSLQQICRIGAVGIVARRALRLHPFVRVACHDRIPVMAMQAELFRLGYEQERMHRDVGGVADLAPPCREGSVEEPFSHVDGVALETEFVDGHD